MSNFSWRSAQTLLGELAALPQTLLAGFKGLTSKGREWKETDRTECEWKEREGRDESVVESKNVLKIHPS